MRSGANRGARARRSIYAFRLPVLRPRGNTGKRPAGIPTHLDLSSLLIDRAPHARAWVHPANFERAEIPLPSAPTFPSLLSEACIGHRLAARSECPEPNLIERSCA